MPLLLDLLPLGQTLRPEDIVTAVCFDGDVQGQPALASDVLVNPAALLGIVWRMPTLLAGFVLDPPAVVGELASLAALGGFVVPTADTGGRVLGLPAPLQGHALAVWLSGTVVALPALEGAVVGPLLAGNVLGSPALAGRVYGRECLMI